MSSYTSLEALLHDAFWATEESPELAWIDAILTRRPGRALEIGCGSGRLLLPLVQKGHRIDGIDLSADMLALCRSAAAALGVEPVLHHGDMTTFSPPQPYEILLVPAFTLQLAGDPAAALRHFHQLLVPGGLLYLTVFVPLAEIHRELPENTWYPDHQTTLPDGRKASVETRHRIDRKQRLLHREHLYQLSGPDGVIEHRCEETIRWFTPRTLARVLKESGFKVTQAVADFDDDIPVTDEAQILTVLAERC